MGKNALAMKKKGVGIFAPKILSPALAEICGAKKLPRTEVTKKIWVYIKKNSLNNGRTIKPDSKLKAVLPVASLDMLKMASYVSKHLPEPLGKPWPFSRRVLTSRRAPESRPQELDSCSLKLATHTLLELSLSATLACFLERWRGRPGELQP